MADNNEIILDAASGIPVEEQKEILDKINGIAEKNRIMLSQGAGSQKGKNRGKTPVINAKKSGAFFPLAVNIAAVIVLCGCVMFLFLFNVRVDAGARTGNAVYNLTEKALVEEIRKDTEEKIAEKDMEISSISSRLQEVGERLLQLQSGSQDLTGEQLAARERFLTLQSSYGEELSVLRDERSRILEDARSREAILHAQFEQRTGELAASRQVVSVWTDSAIDELERLSGEQEKIAAIDAYLAGGLASVSVLVQTGQYEQAAGTIENLRLFCNNNSLAAARSFQPKKEIYNQAIESMETIVDEIRKFQAVNGEGWALFEKNAQLEETVAEMQKTIDASNAGSSGQARRLAEMEKNISDLRASVSSLETRVTERDRTISSLNTERATLTQTVTELRSVNEAQEQSIANLRNRLEMVQQALQE